MASTHKSNKRNLQWNIPPSQNPPTMAELQTHSPQATKKAFWCVSYENADLVLHFFWLPHMCRIVFKNLQNMPFWGECCMKPTGSKKSRTDNGRLLLRGLTWVFEKQFTEVTLRLNSFHFQHLSPVCNCSRQNVKLPRTALMWDTQRRPFGGFLMIPLGTEMSRCVVALFVSFAECGFMY